MNPARSITSSATCEPSATTRRVPGIGSPPRCSSMMSIAARFLQRAADLLDRIDFTPAGLRADLANRHASARRLYSAAEMIDRAADLFSEFAGLVHDNERRWRVFRARVQHYADTRG